MINTGIGDIAFVIDTSGSMTGVFNYLIENLGNNMMNIQEKIKDFHQFDIRISVVAGDRKKFFVIPFTGNMKDIVSKLEYIKEQRSRANEIMCYGIDIALRDLDWRLEAKRIMVMITDEKLETNYKPKKLKEHTKYEQLKNRIEESDIILHFVTPLKCPDYNQLNEINKAIWYPIESTNELMQVENIEKIFNVFIASIAKSMSSIASETALQKYDDYIYNFPETAIIRL